MQQGQLVGWFDYMFDWYFPNIWNSWLIHCFQIYFWDAETHHQPDRDTFAGEVWKGPAGWWRVGPRRTRMECVQKKTAVFVRSRLLCTQVSHRYFRVLFVWLYFATANQRFQSLVE